MTNLPFLVGLTADERKSLNAIDVSNKAFTEDAINAGVNNPTLIPSYLSVANMKNDLTLFTQLDEISSLANQLCERIEDTKMLAGYCKRYTLQFAVLWKLSLVLKHNFITQLGEYLPYRFETIRERALQQELAEKDAIIQKMEIQLEVFRERIQRQ